MCWVLSRTHTHTTNFSMCFTCVLLTSDGKLHVKYFDVNTPTRVKTHGNLSKVGVLVRFQDVLKA